MQERSAIVLELPAEARFLAVVRSVAATAAAGLDLPYDAVDDLRIAVDEAASLLLSRRPNPTRLTIDVRSDPGAVQVTVRTDAVVSGWPDDDAALAGLSWTIIARLVDEAGAEATASGPAIRLTRRIPHARKDP